MFGIVLNSFLIFSIDPNLNVHLPNFIESNKSTPCIIILITYKKVSYLF